MAVVKSQAQLSRELQVLRRAFLTQLPDRVRDIETAMNDALNAQDLDRADALFHLAHRLCGSAGIYGYPTVQAAAAALESVADALREAGGKGEPSQLAELRRLVEMLRTAVADATLEPPAKE